MQSTSLQAHQLPERRKLVLARAFGQSGEPAVLELEQFGRVALFDDFAAVEHNDGVETDDGSQPVGDGEDGGVVGGKVVVEQRLDFGVRVVVD